MTNAERSLTFDEAAHRAGLVAVDRYDVEVDLTGLLDGAELRSTSTVRFGCTRPGESTFVDCVAEVEEAALNGLVLDKRAVREGRIELTDLEAENVLVVRSVQRRHRPRPGRAPVRGPAATARSTSGPASSPTMPAGLRLLRPARPQGGVRRSPCRARRVDRH